MATNQGKNLVNRRDMNPVSINSTGPRQKYSKTAGIMANNNIANLENIKNTKALISGNYNIG